MKRWPINLYWLSNQAICCGENVHQKSRLDLRWRRGSRHWSKKFDVVREWIFQNLYFNTIYLVSKYNAKITDHIMEDTTTSRWRLISLFYGDVLIIVENWQFVLLFFLRESIDWISSRKIFIVPIWNLVNVIQQRNLQRADGVTLGERRLFRRKLLQILIFVF